MAAAPSLWQQSLAAAAAGGTDAAVPAVAAVAPVDADEKLSTTWTHVVAVAGSEAKAMDLADLMGGAKGREDTYQFPVPGVSWGSTGAHQHRTGVPVASSRICSVCSACCCNAEPHSSAPSCLRAPSCFTPLC